MAFEAALAGDWLFAALTSDIGLAKSRRCTDPLAHGLSGTYYQDYDRERIGDHLQEEAPIWVVVERVSHSQEECRSLDVQDQAS